MTSALIDSRSQSQAQADHIERVVDDSLLSNVLQPYKPHCRYLKRGTVSIPLDEPGRASPRISGDFEFEIPESCYIDSTGHFNAVEFNICYNQMAYALLGEGLMHGALSPFSWSLDEYYGKMLPNCVIARLSSAFSKMIRPGTILGHLELESVTARKGNVWLPMTCRFTDGVDGAAHGAVTVVVIQGATQGAPASASDGS